MLVPCPNQSRSNYPFELRFTNAGDYYVTSISRHPDDSHLCDDTTRWWPLWHEYKNDKKMSLSSVLGCYLIQSEKQILVNKFFRLTLFT